ncbi:MAG: hypothetical protein K9J13_01855 [Saprospiraceae bacterium]|nr:hypothetical protein [Saprospiraceae bacterium]
MKTINIILIGILITCCIFGCRLSRLNNPKPNSYYGTINCEFYNDLSVLYNGKKLKKYNILIYYPRGYYKIFYNDSICNDNPFLSKLNNVNSWNFILPDSSNRVFYSKESEINYKFSEVDSVFNHLYFEKDKFISLIGEKLFNSQIDSLEYNIMLFPHGMGRLASTKVITSNKLEMSVLKKYIQEGNIILIYNIKAKKGNTTVRFQPILFIL